jgi:hypothetical protein
MKVLKNSVKLTFEEADVLYRLAVEAPFACVTPEAALLRLDNRFVYYLGALRPQWRAEQERV